MRPLVKEHSRGHFFYMRITGRRSFMPRAACRGLCHEAFGFWGILQYRAGNSGMLDRSRREGARNRPCHKLNTRFPKCDCVVA